MTGLSLMLLVTVTCSSAIRRTHCCISMAVTFHICILCCCRIYVRKI